MLGVPDDLPMLAPLVQLRDLEADVASGEYWYWDYVRQKFRLKGSSLHHLIKARIFGLIQSRLYQGS
jgi:hypothetical protein